MLDAYYKHHLRINAYYLRWGIVNKDLGEVQSTKGCSHHHRRLWPRRKRLLMLWKRSLDLTN